MVHSLTRFTSRLLASALLAAAFSSPASAAAPRRSVAVPEVGGLGEVDSKAIAGLSPVLVAEVARLPLRVLAGSDLRAMLSFDRQRKLLGCTEASCLEEIGGALGVDYLLVPEVSRLGGTWLLSLTLLDVARHQAVARANRRASGLEGLLDATPAAVREVFAALQLSPAASAPQAEAHPDRTLGYVLDAAGAALIAGGAGFGLAALSSRQRAMDLATQARQGEVASRGEFESSWSAFQRQATIADVCYAGGALALGAGLYFTFFAQPAQLALSPNSSGGMSALLSGSF